MCNHRLAMERSPLVRLSLPGRSIVHVFIPQWIMGVQRGGPWPSGCKFTDTQSCYHVLRIYSRHVLGPDPIPQWKC